MAAIPATQFPSFGSGTLGKLYLDLNRNRDLTDDSAGVFSARETQRVYYQTFTNVHLLFNTASGESPVLAEVNFYDYGSRPSCSLAVRSLWQGKVTLQGRDWQVGIVPNNLNQSGSLENGRLLLRLWEKRNQPFNTYDGSLATIPFSRNLFVDGHAYQLNLTVRPQDGETRLALQFIGTVRSTGRIENHRQIYSATCPAGRTVSRDTRSAGARRAGSGRQLQPA